MLIDLRSLNLEELEKLMLELQESKFRSKQIFSWVHAKGVSNFAEMTNVPGKLRDKLLEKTVLNELDLIKSQVSKDGTTKYLLKLADNNYIECVLMKYQGTKARKRNTLCISSQVGCAMGCGFCATGKGGFTRNLSVGEILGQVYLVTKLESIYEENFKINNVVYMGMGEPLLNFTNVIKSIYLLNNSEGQNIGMRRITVSTCGIVPKIIELADLDLDLVLAISLHAATDTERSKLMPVNNKYPLSDLKNACKYYIEKTKRRITFEYALVNDVNDNAEDAKDLANYLKDLMCHINLIPVNPVNKIHTRPSRKKVTDFSNWLNKFGINASIREEKGLDIDGACGQLSGRMEE
ncbi:23S rRNA m(2)A-2503 methyltransferase [Desulfonispora thiosulfatigenes DSM 11270]|uniref:Probable dual-specificity RNA methyltransferase RlmN n=1 Tax=Desulfonispora thiosulfatigenes DSM 11270 TaxID=656914 RepID=A0A1W1VKD9_DESTI|nr:23S rRNA (adenine(2503)-C(2))-methyltransferase RlmN [Desulfonispora thiosulfatigenes]SMB93414.1 23S rRNA m(2)A-2503 methyltransferase [Desulfonispora thiosulfatigenes DSM 11270]